MLSLEMEFKEFEPRFKSAKTRFELSANQPYLSRGLNLKCRSNSLNSATVLIKTLNAPILTLKIRQIEYQTGDGI